MNRGAKYLKAPETHSNKPKHYPRMLAVAEFRVVDIDYTRPTYQIVSDHPNLQKPVWFRSKNYLEVGKSYRGLFEAPPENQNYIPPSITLLDAKNTPIDDLGKPTGDPIPWDPS